MDDHVRVEALDVLLRLAELVGCAVVDEPVLGRGGNVVEDLRDLFAVGRVVAVVVASGEPVGVVEGGPVVRRNRRQLGPREPIESVEVAA